MLNYKDKSTYGQQFKIWKELSADVWIDVNQKDKDGKDVKKRQKKISYAQFVKAFTNAGIELKSQKGTDLSVGRINGHLNTLKDHIAELGKLNGVSEEKIENWKSNVRLCLIKEDVAEIKGLVTDDAFFSSL